MGLTLNRDVKICLGLSLVAACAIFALELHNARARYHHLEAKRSLIADNPQALTKFIDSNKGSSNKKTQDLVTEAKLQFAYLQVTKNHSQRPTAKTYESARQTFAEAAKDYKGTGDSSGDFGSLSDQALYQADVCLVAEGKTAQAAKAFREFMASRPESPLCKACFDRLRRLNGGISDGGYISPSDQALFQHDLNFQAAKIRYATSICGPECIAKAEELLGKKPQSIKEIAVGAGRTDKGTTIYGLRKYLREHGTNSFAYALNSVDFRSLPTPAILSVPNHFVVVIRIIGATMRVYDPLTSAEKDVQMPSLDDRSFVANVITFSVPAILN